MDARTSICTAQSQLGLRAGIALALLAAAFSAARAETVVSNAFGRLAVNFCREDLVHFRYAPGGAEFTPQAVYVARQAIEKTDADYAPVKVRESRSPDGVTSACGKTSVSVDANTLGIAVSVDGRVVFRSAAEAFSADGEGRRASFVRDVAGEERFMGLGNIPGNDFKSCGKIYCIKSSLSIFRTFCTEL